MCIIFIQRFNKFNFTRLCLEGHLSCKTILQKLPWENNYLFDLKKATQTGQFRFFWGQDNLFWNFQTQSTSSTTGGLVITPRQGVAITPSSRKILCGNDFYKTKYSKIFRILQKVIFAEMNFITPSCRNWSGNDFYYTKFENLRFFLRIKV